MSDKKSNAEVLNSLKHDPLMWIRVVLCVGILVSWILPMTGAFALDNAAFDTAMDVFLAVFGVTLIVEVARGRYMGADRDMRTGEKVFSATLGVLLIVVEVVDLCRPMLGF